LSESIFCPNCGERISARARFCPSCGARQGEFRVAPPETEEPTAADPAPVVTYPPQRGVSDHSPGELSTLLRERLALPGIVAAGIAGATSAGIVLVAGLLIALITPDASILGTVGQDASVVTETFRQAVGTLLTAMVDPGLVIPGSRRIHPMLLLAIPLSALIFTTRWQLHRTEGAAPLARLGWAALIAVPFGLLMLAFAIIGGETETTRISPSPGSAFALGLLWGALGGLIGAATKLPLRESVVRIPPAVRTVGAATLATLRPLAAVLVICTLVGLLGWLVQVGADAGGVRNGRSAATALIEEAAFAGEDGVNLTALAAGARFRADANGPLGLPFPVADANDVPGSSGAFRIFAYDDALPAYVLLPALVLLMGLTTLAALYAGFAAARAVRAGTLGTGAAWGAITGPAWAFAMALLVILAGGIFHGDADDASVFGVFVLGGALLGAAGGALAVSGQAPGDGASPS
jgi:zinc ribbon protein